VKVLEALITLEYKDEKTAKSITKAISPDNFNTPALLHVKTIREENKVTTEIKCEGKFTTFISTIDDLLFCASTAEKTLEAVKKSSKETKK
jgi:hypothetical protein